MSDIVVLGSLNMDLVINAQRAPEAGETLPASDFHTIPGGKGANQAAAIGKLGASVAMIGSVGADDFGRQLRNALAEHKVAIDHVRIAANQPTGSALIVVEASGENRILIVAGANGEVSQEDVLSARQLIQQTRLLVMQLEIPLATVTYAANLAQEAGIPILLNPSPAYPLDGAFLQKIKYLCLNETEATSLSGIKVKDLESAEKAARALQATTAGVIILTLGAQGAILTTPEEQRHFPAFSAPVVDTTAAGDAFIGAFAVSLINGKDLEDCVRYANAAGALATTRLGAQTSLPSADQVNGFLKDQSAPLGNYP